MQPITDLPRHHQPVRHHILPHGNYTTILLSAVPGPRSSAGIPPCREPVQIRFVPVPRLLLTGEERVGLVQDECEGAALPPGHVGDGEFGGIDPRVDVLPALLGERPLKGAPALVFQEYAESAAQLAAQLPVGSSTDQSPDSRCGRASRVRSRAAQSAARSPKPASPRAPAPATLAAARSADISRVVTTSLCSRTYPQTLSRVPAAPITAAASAPRRAAWPGHRVSHRDSWVTATRARCRCPCRATPTPDR